VSLINTTGEGGGGKETLFCLKGEKPINLHTSGGGRGTFRGIEGTLQEGRKKKGRGITMS